MREGGGGTPPATEDDGRDRPDRPSSAAGRRDDGLTVVRIHPTPGARVWGAFVAGDPVWPRAVTVALVVELVLLAGVSIARSGFGAEPPHVAFLPMLAAPAAALGLQSIAIQRFGVSGLSTTYLTGTLTTVVIRLVPGHGVRAVRHSALILLGLVVGAAAIAGLLASVPMLAPVLLVGTVGSVLVVVLLRRALVHR